MFGSLVFGVYYHFIADTIEPRGPCGTDGAGFLVPDVSDHVLPARDYRTLRLGAWRDIAPGSEANYQEQCGQELCGSIKMRPPVKAAVSKLKNRRVS